MSLVRVQNFSVSLDGFGTGEPQSLEGIESDFDIEMTPSPTGVTHLTFTRSAD
jgi:hypothetical protein